MQMHAAAFDDIFRDAVYAPCRKGDPEAPLTDADLNDKFAELAAPAIGEAAAQRLLQQLWQMERLQVADLRLVAL